MTENEQSEERLKALRDTAARGRGRFRMSQIDQEWAWRKLGVVFACLLAILIAMLTLSPMPVQTVRIDGIDKVYHFIAFAALIFPLILTDSRRWSWAVPLVIFYGGAIELIQPTVGRTAEWLDFGANLSGVLAGAALAEILHDRIRRSVFDRDTDAEALNDAQQDEARLDAMRLELMDELREVLREELAAVQRPGAEVPVGPSPAEEAMTRAAHPELRLRAVHG